VSKRSPYLPAAIVRICNVFGAGTHSHEQSVISLIAFGELLRNGMPQGFHVLFLTDMSAFGLGMLLPSGSLTVGRYSDILVFSV
jgi:hypothetical protein